MFGTPDVACSFYYGSFSIFNICLENPDDFPFEESPCKAKQKDGTLGRKKSKQKLNKQKKETDVFQRKRESEEKIYLIDSDIQEDTANSTKVLS